MTEKTTALMLFKIPVMTFLQTITHRSKYLWKHAILTNNLFAIAEKSFKTSAEVAMPFL